MDERQDCGVRLCPHCRAAEPVRAGESPWPSGWACGACGNAVPVRDDVPHYAPALADTRIGFEPALFRSLAARESGHFWFEPRNRLLVELANRYLPNRGPYLEIGCGTGFVLTAFARAWPHTRVIGSELHPAGLQFARRRLGDRAEFVQMDARTIPASDVFRLIGAFDVLEHIEEDETVIAAVFSALVAGGGFIAAVPQHPSLWSDMDEVGEHVRRYQRGELEGKLRAVGFEILRSTSYNTALLPLMWWSRVVSRRRSGHYKRPAAEHEMSVPRRLNAALRGILDAEVTLTLRGVSWPVGGSRVVVARKPERWR